MIITTTPLRISFFGGGSDIEQYYNYNPGMVISTTINKYIHIALNKCEPNYVRAVYSETEVVKDSTQLKHDRIKYALDRFGIHSNIEICSFSDVSTKGTGLGSSSTFTVGLLRGLFEHNKMIYNRRDLAEIACDIEINKCRAPIGKQDQYAAAYGGFNVIRFDSSGVEVTPINIDAHTLQDLNRNLMCFSTGQTRNTNDILSDQVKSLENLSSKTSVGTTNLVAHAEQALDYLKTGRIDDFGALLHETWMCKRKLSKNITNPDIDTMYEIATSAGALGGKLLGAGGGGYMLFYVPESSRGAVALAMREYRRFHFNFTEDGSKSVTL